MLLNSRTAYKASKNARNVCWHSDFFTILYSTWSSKVNSQANYWVAVICVLHGYAFGLAIDIATCADIRLCSADVKLAVKEVDIGIAADIGTLTRLPKIVGSFSWVKDVALSARVFGADEAYRVGFVSQVLGDKQKTVEAAFKMAELLATKSPVAVQGTKELLNHARDHTTADSLRYTGVWNSAAIQTRDMEVAMLSGLKKTKPRFEKL